MPENNLIPKKYRFAFLLFNDGLELLLLGLGPGQTFRLLNLILHRVHLIVNLERRGRQNFKERLSIVQHIEFILIVLIAIGLEVQFRVRVPAIKGRLTILRLCSCGSGCRWTLCGLCDRTLDFAKTFICDIYNLKIIWHTFFGWAFLGKGRGMGWVFAVSRLYGLSLKIIIILKKIRID